MKEARPPKRITDLLEWVCPDYLFEGIVGDLEEQFSVDVEELGLKRARRRYWWGALKFFRPEILLRNKFKLNIINNIMLLNHLKIGVRSILKRKLYSFINAVGLSIAISFSILIYLFIQDEKSFDQFHAKKDRIYRVHAVRTIFDPKEGEEPVEMFAWVQTGLAPVLKEESGAVVKATGYSAGSSAIFKVSDKIFNENVTFVHQDFFHMFGFETIYGSQSSFLSDPSHIVLSDATSKKYFGDENPVGKQVELVIYNVNRVFTVVGVIEDVPANSSLDYGAAFVSVVHRPYYERNIDNWMSWNTPTFVMVNENTSKEQLLQSLQDVQNKYIQPKIDETFAESGHEPRSKSEFDAVLLPDIHLYADVNWTRVSDPQSSLILSGIAILILLIACINYIALAMASSAGKRLEVGIRKAVGGARKQLIGQFMIESILLSMVAMAISICLIVVFLPYFNEFTSKSIVLTDKMFEIGLVTFLFTMLIGIIAGIYPAFVLSGFKPLSMLRSRSFSKVRASITRPLVVFQFGISAFLIICSVVMLRQMNFITTKNLGYNQDQVLVIPTYTGYTEEGEKAVERFRNATAENNNIVSVSGTNSSFNRGWSRNGFRIDGELHNAYTYRVDEDYIPTLGIKLKEGRNFDKEIVTDQKKTLIVNEALVADFGWEDPLNQTLNWRDDSLGGWKIIGVVEDYHFLSLENEVEPMFMFLDEEEGKITTMLVKVRADDIPATIEYAQNKWQEVVSDKPFDFAFLDEDVAKQYESYEKWSNIMWVATLFAILIACLGLFGLAGINALNRTKEIGIRKALGAEIRDILVMMNRPYAIMALISFVLAAPASWWVMDKWLSDFKYAISLSWQLFVVSLVSALILALFTVSYHSVKAALINPADTLKYE